MEDDIRAVEEDLGGFDELNSVSSGGGRDSEQRQRGRARNYVFTLWQDFSVINQIIARRQLPEYKSVVRGTERTYAIRFLTGQFELSPETQREHFQGYIQFADKVSGIALMQNIFGACHVEVARGSVESCIKYCTKEETRLRGPYTFGTPMQQGQRSDLLGFKRAIQEGQTNKELWQGEFFGTMLRHHRTVPILRSYLVEPRGPRRRLSDFCVPALSFDPKRSWVLCGETNIGKTSYAEAHFDKPFVVRHIDDLLKFDGSLYDGIVFDDLDWRQATFSDILNVIDVERECSVNCRYYTATIPSGTPRIFCTNREDLFESHKISPSQLDAVKRRIQIYKPIKLFDVPGTE